jgi:hypothetical protein
VAGVAEPGEFINDGAENGVGCIVITSAFDGDGVCIEGTPDDLVSLAHRILNAANAVKSDTNGSRKLRRLYGIVNPLDSDEPSLAHEEMGRQVLDDQHFEPEYREG